MLRSDAATRLSHWLRFWPLGASFLIALAVACGTTSTAGLPPVTGIIIRAETLTTGRGCGVGPTQLYRYIATVYNDAQFTQQVVTNTFDCFTDGEFVSVPGGDRTFYLQVFAFNKPTWDQAGAPPDTTKANWATTCVATQQHDVLALADCLPLGSGNLGQADIQITTGSFPLPDGGTASCVNPPDGGAVADADAEADADTDAAPDDGGTDADAAVPPPATTATFAKAVFRVVRRGTDEIATVGTVTCPAPFLARVPTGDYRIDVGLTDAVDVPVAELTCSVRATPAAAATATCP